MSPSIAISHLHVAYRDHLVLKDINVNFSTGAVTGILGPNGAGKSTMIKAMLGLVPKLSGDVTFFGQPLSEARSRIGYMPQSTSVDWDFPTTVNDVVTMGTYQSLGWFKRPGLDEQARALSAMDRAGILDLSDRQIGELSGGQKQRVFLARTLAGDPDIYLMDEPLAGVDAKSQKAIIEVLHSLRASGKSIVIVHHDLLTVSEYCDDVVLLNQSVVAAGPTETEFTPANICSAYETHDPTDMFWRALA